MLTVLRRSNRKVVGLKQTLKVALQGDASCIFLADDADAVIREKILTVCAGNDIQLVSVDSKARLGEACGIDVGSATAALLKE